MPTAYDQGQLRLAFSWRVHPRTLLQACPSPPSSRPLPTPPRPSYPTPPFAYHPYPTRVRPQTPPVHAPQHLKLSATQPLWSPHTRRGMYAPACSNDIADTTQLARTHSSSQETCLMIVSWDRVVGAALVLPPCRGRTRGSGRNEGGVPSWVMPVRAR